MSKFKAFTHDGLNVKYLVNDIGNTLIHVYLSKDVYVDAVCFPNGEVYTAVLCYGQNDSLWFGEFTMESNTPGNAQVQIAPWLPLLNPIFAKCKSVSA